MLRIRPFVLFGCLALALATTACGGGGDDPVLPAAPGVLRALAVQGQPAPGTAGNFGVFPGQPLMDVAAGGWSAFVAPTTDGAKPQVLYVAQPDATVVEVFAVNEAVPLPGTGNITGFTGVWMCPGGIVLVSVTISGGIPTFGVLSALVTGGVATQKDSVIYEGDGLPGPIVGVLNQFDPTTATNEDDGTLWIKGMEGAPNFFWHLFSVDRDGSNLTVRAQRTGPLPGGDSISTVDAFAVDPTGAFYAIVATPIILGPRRILLRATGGPVFAEVMRAGDPLPSGGGTVLNIHTNGWLNVFGVGQVAWMAQGTNPAPDDVFLFGTSVGLAGVQILARSGDLAPNTGGTYGTMNGMNQASGSLIPQFAAQIVAAPLGSTFGTFGLLTQAGPPLMGTSHLMPADVGQLGATYVGLSPLAPPYTQISTDGSFLFANVLTGGLSAVLWMIPLTGVFALAVETGPAPGGDTFGSFAASSAHVCADNVALFRAPLVTAGSGIFRRGP